MNMQAQHFNFNQLYYLSLALLLSLLLISTKSSASFYDERPDILKVEAVDHIKGSKTTLKDWSESSHGHFVLLAELLTFFPDSEFYFLARDIEYLHDIARVLFKNDPVMKKRLHLIPVSTQLSYDEYNVRKYLQQEGITSENLGNRTALIVDSCCSGSVPDAIISAFAGKKVKIKGFLIQTDEYPNSRLAENLGADGGDIEGLPHYNNSATEYVVSSKKIRIETGGVPSERKHALKIMQQIRFDFDNAKTRKEFAELLSLMRTVYAYTAKQSSYKKPSKAQAEKALKTMNEKFEIFSSIFLDDVSSMSRKKYASIDKARVKAILKTKTSNIELNNLVRWIMLDPDAHEEISEKIGDSQNIEFKDIFVKAIEQLNKSTPKDLNLSEVEYNKLVRRWLRVMDDYQYPYQDHVDEVSPALYELILKTNGAQKAAEYLADNSYYFSETSDKEKISLIIAAIAADEYKYFGSSAIRKFISEFVMLTDSPSIFKAVVADFIKNAKPQDIMKVTEKILEKLNDFSYEYEDFKVLNEVLKSLITASPKISREMVQQILASKHLNHEISMYNMGFKNPAQPFLKWFFSQSSKFSIDSKNLRLNTKQAYNVTLTKWHTKPLVTDVLQYSKDKPKAKLCAISTRKK